MALPLPGKELSEALKVTCLLVPDLRAGQWRSCTSGSGARASCWLERREALASFPCRSQAAELTRLEQRGGRSYTSLQTASVPLALCCQSREVTSL